MEIQKSIDMLVNHKNLSRKECYLIFKELLDEKYGERNDVYLGSFLTAMQSKGPTQKEVAGLMDVVLRYDRIPVNVQDDSACGIVGSGRDTFKTINVSTAAAVVASGLGVKVVKNGSRSETSVSGTTDVLEAVGVNIMSKEEDMIESLNKNNLGFFDAKPYFPRMFKKYVGKFPFINPLSYALSMASGVEFKRMIFGLSSSKTEFTANILKELGFKSALVVQGLDNSKKRIIDELSILGRTKISELKNGKIRTYYLSPRQVGLSMGNPSDIAQHPTNEENSFHLVEILLGKSNKSSREIVALNAGALLYISGKEKSLKSAIKKSLVYIESGDAIHQLEALIKTSKGDISKLQKYIEKSIQKRS